MGIDYRAFLEKSILDMLQYNRGTTIDSVLAMVFETILKAEQKGFLGYEYGDRSSKDVDNKRNGYTSTLVKALNNMVRISVPRDRLGLFKPVILALLREQDTRINELAFELYVKGLSTRDIHQIIEKFYEGKKLSPAAVSLITNECKQAGDQWRNRKLDSEYYCIYSDAIFIPTRRDTVQSEAYYIVLGLKKDLKREILGIYNLPTESASGWGKICNDLKDRGVEKILLWICDDVKGIDLQIQQRFRGTRIQKCIVHKERNLSTVVRSYDKKVILAEFKETLGLDDPNYKKEQALEKLTEFVNKWSKKYSSIKAMFNEEKREQLYTFLDFPFAIRRMIYTTNWIENLNTSIKRGTKIRGAFPSPDSALTLVSFICREKEDLVYKKPVTAFSSSKYGLDQMLAHMRPRPPVLNATA